MTSQREEACSGLRLTHSRQGSVGWRERQMNRTRRTDRGRLTLSGARAVKAHCPRGEVCPHLLQQSV